MGWGKRPQGGVPLLFRPAVSGMFWYSSHCFCAAYSLETFGAVLLGSWPGHMRRSSCDCFSTAFAQPARRGRESRVVWPDFMPLALILNLTLFPARSECITASSWSL